MQTKEMQINNFIALDRENGGRPRLIENKGNTFETLVSMAILGQEIDNRYNKEGPPENGNDKGDSLNIRAYPEIVRTEMNKNGNDKGDSLNIRAYPEIVRTELDIDSRRIMRDIDTDVIIERD